MRSTVIKAASYIEITTAIDSCAPVAAGIGIQPATGASYGHDISIIGYNPNGQLLYLEDPEGYGPNFYSYAAMTAGNCAYNGGTIVSWQETAFTRAS